MRVDAGAILGWKYNNAEGITTIDGKIKNWPAALGARPTNAQVTAWGVEYDAAMLAIKNAETARQARRLKDMVDDLPSWLVVKARIDDAFPDPKQNAFVTKMSKMLYWLAKDSDD